VVLRVAISKISRALEMETFPDAAGDGDSSLVKSAAASVGGIL
jgi:hypothetical protein